MSRRSLPEITFSVMEQIKPGYTEEEAMVLYRALVEIERSAMLFCAEEVEDRECECSDDIHGLTRPMEYLG